MPRHLVLVGLPGCGKSAVGQGATFYFTLEPEAR